MDKYKCKAVTRLVLLMVSLVIIGVMFIMLVEKENEDKTKIEEEVEVEVVDTSLEDNLVLIYKDAYDLVNSGNLLSYDENSLCSLVNLNLLESYFTDNAIRDIEENLNLTYSDGSYYLCCDCVFEVGKVFNTYYNDFNVLVANDEYALVKLDGYGETYYITFKNDGTNWLIELFH